MGSYWMRKARRGQLQNAGHFAVLVACRLRSPIVLSEEESQRVVVQVIDALRLRRLQEAIVASCLLEPQTGASPVLPSLAISFLQIGFPRNMWSGRQGLYLEDDGQEPLACSTPIEQQLAGQLFELSDQPQNGTKRVPG
ncbi:unnamed protein product [Sphagnum jensenii]|uniref:Uncharacterized protein n=1 Tax=Sphagnum jensenii TaxID=128206 RepID=A0ABP1A4U3_9BRYO